MTLEEKIGQLFMVHVYGADINDRSSANVKGNRDVYGLDTIAEVIRTYKPGGVIYFQWTDNLHDLDQIARLSKDLQQLSLEATGTPLLIGIDQEHGVVRRIGPPLTEFPGSMALAAAGDPQLGFEAAYITALELTSLGINVNFAPVADVNVNPDNPIIGTRSFGDRASSVSEYVTQQVRGFAAGQIGASAKHFPGHGDTDVDSHTGLPRIGHTLQEIREIDLPPFQAAIDAGVDMIMTAHVVVPALDPSDRPATMSQAILTRLLREEMNFQGVIVTDALNMAGARVTFDPHRVPVEAIKAGADLLLMPPDFRVAFHAVLQAVASGEISEERIDESVRRILALKEKLSQSEPVQVGPQERTRHQHVAQTIAERSITTIRLDVQSWPVDPGQTGRVLVTGWGDDTVHQLADLLGQEGFDVSARPSGSHPGAGERDAVADLAPNHDLIIMLIHNARRSAGQLELAHRLAQSGVPIIFVLLDLPYDAPHLPPNGSIIATYGYRPVSLSALVRALIGDIETQGRLPVHVPGIAL